MDRVAKQGLWSSLMLTVALLVGCDAAPAQSERGEPPLPSVRIDMVRLAEDQVGHHFPGTLRASERAAPAFLHDGVLRERHVPRGQRVERGEPLARLHNPALAPTLAAGEARIRELDATLSRLGRDVERARTLRERNLTAEEELDRLRAEYRATAEAREQALAQRDEAQAQLDELTLRAPFDAEVSDLLVEPGEFVTAGQPVLTLVGIAEREVEIHMPAGLAARLEEGRAASLTMMLGGRHTEGRIAAIGRAAEGMAPVIIAVDSALQAAPGEPVRVGLAFDAQPVLQVPLAAVVDPGGDSPHVLLVTADDTIRRIAVTPGRLTGNWVTLPASSLAAGDRVVTAGQGRLEEGDRVRVLP
ncbi:efflux RND transporter periplasmic adaptor subunit [Halomonas sp. ML-15]|uniref:efflux RND transporter periplasmic adaptor subunit n=1 Tax=Halomonas sp. ML-15 TaxID=2773305 RepID=UPI0017462D80|nr:efflux RND transporter periplasmic adaptor subunit [Halomonas sp. ML-15]MBD3895799.1 efflux RND transporter periplasmic adaptor subunit [Halomonas sp. ML-15]